MTPDAMYQYRGLGGRDGVMVFWVEQLDDGRIRPMNQLFDDKDERDPMKDALSLRTQLALRADVQRIIIAVVTQELRREPVVDEGAVILPFNHARPVNGRHE